MNVRNGSPVETCPLFHGGADLKGNSVINLALTRDIAWRDLALVLLVQKPRKRLEAQPTNARCLFSDSRQLDQLTRGERITCASCGWEIQHIGENDPLIAANPQFDLGDFLNS